MPQSEMNPCRHCGMAIVPDPTDSEDWVHKDTIDATCTAYYYVGDSYAEPNPPPKPIRCDVQVTEIGNSRFPYNHFCDKPKDHVPPHKCRVNPHCGIEWTTETTINSKENK